MKKLILTLDRREGDIAVCIDESENIYEFPSHPLSQVNEGEFFTAGIDDDGNLTVLDLMEQENSDEHRKRAERTRKLFRN